MTDWLPLSDDEGCVMLTALAGCWDDEERQLLPAVLPDLLLDQTLGHVPSVPDRSADYGRREVLCSGRVPPGAVRQGGDECVGSSAETAPYRVPRV